LEESQKAFFMVAEDFDGLPDSEPISVKLQKSENWTGIFVRPNLCGVDDEKGKVRSVRHARCIRHVR
jgi:hypothetical protein